MYRVLIVFLLLLYSQRSDIRPHEYVNFNNSDTFNLACIIHAECGICGDSEQALTGSVVLNRVDSRKFPNDIVGVISQRRQFYAYCSEHYYPGGRTFSIASGLLKGINRNKEVLHFYGDSSTDTTFVNSMKGRTLFYKKYHNYAK